MGKKMSEWDRWPTITDAEIAKHNTDKDCWIALHNLVLKLDETFMNEHPGGPDVVTTLAGKDATQDFEDIAHSENARTWGSKFIIGCREGAPEECMTMKALPEMAAISSSGGGNVGMLMAIVVVILAAVFFF